MITHALKCTHVYNGKSRRTFYVACKVKKYLLDGRCKVEVTHTRYGDKLDKPSVRYVILSRVIEADDRLQAFFKE